MICLRRDDTVLQVGSLASEWFGSLITAKIAFKLWMNDVLIPYADQVRVPRSRTKLIGVVSGGSVSGVEQQRVLGWVVLTLSQPAGPLTSASTVSHSVGKDGTVAVEWRDGPTAWEASECLMAAADPEMPVSCSQRQSDRDHDPDVAELAVAGVPLMLIAWRPDAGGPPWRWPNPLHDRGFAEHEVLWHLPPAGADDVGCATVAESPLPKEGGGSCVRGSLIVNVDHTHSEFADVHEVASWRRHREIADIGIRVLETEGEADEWLATAPAGAIGGPLLHAALIPGGTALMTIRTRAIGWRIRAHCVDGGPRPGPGTVLVPAAVLSATSVNPDRRPPAMLRLRRLGNTSTTLFELDATVIPPSVR